MPIEDLDSVIRKEKLSTVKLHASQYVVALVLFVLGAGLWHLQILGADNYRVLAEQNRIRKVPVLAPRGRIFDREGRIIVDNYPSVSCYLLRDQQKNLEADIPLIAAGLHISVEQVQATLRHYQYAPKYQSIPLKQDITPDEQAFIEAHRNELPELETLEEQRRLYPRDGFAAHLIGYVGEVSENDLNQTKFAFYAPGDMVGKSGVEEAYDEILRGTDGSRDVIVNSHGKEVGVMGQEMAVPGKDIRLTIDLDVQMSAEKALEGKSGAIVAMDPHTGEILAMVSRPTFDPNQFAVRLTSAYWQTIRDNPDHPMLNKAIQAQLAPGSTFKVIMTLAGLQENIAQGAIQASPMQLARALSGIASGGALVRPHVIFSDEVPTNTLQAIHEAFPGSGAKQIPITTENWQIITDDMANVLSPIGTAAEAHLEGIDFAGKTGTADVISGRKKGTADKATLPNAWFVGMTPRRNPNIVVAVLWEHGYWGNNSAKLAAQVISAYVNKQRSNAGNLMKVAKSDPAATPADSIGLSDTTPSTPEPTGGADK
jgi:cell division protein FtsI/penicillin-binding protein 2